MAGRSALVPAVLTAAESGTSEKAPAVVRPDGPFHVGLRECLERIFQEASRQDPQKPPGGQAAIPAKGRECGQPQEAQGS